MTQKQFESKQAEVSDTKLIETIETKLSKLCQTGGRSLSMSVPPQVSDIDMAISELIRRYKQLTLTDVSESCKSDSEGLKEDIERFKAINNSR
tara:strand:+ start:199 stop:477 length:279 start_codon:yes stop_codon:yes gene_type:complete